MQSPYGDHLPMFPTFYDRPSEDKLERTIERLTDRADAAFMAGKATQAQYDAWTRALSNWADSVKIEESR
jgi:hypothetical protein